MKSQPKTAVFATLCLALAGGLLPGCGGDPGDNAHQTGQPAAADSQKSGTVEVSPSGKTGLPTAALNQKTSTVAERNKPEPPKEGTPPWYIQQILLLRFEKFPETKDIKELDQLRRERNLKIVKLAEECIAKTHKDAEAEPVFNAAVHQLLEARVALALQGKDEDILALYELATLFYKRDKKSKAAADAAYRVAVFANTNAIRYPDPKSGWLTEFVRRARLFATDFPQDKARAVRLLDVAGKSCEFQRRIKDAITCYEQLRTQFTDMPQAQRAVAVLRRLKLEGKALQMAGPTIDGGFVDIKDYKGKVVLVTFWSTDSKRSQELLPQLQTIGSKYRKSGLEIIGVNLDKEEPVVDTFLEKSKLSWPQIFYPDRNKRRWDNLIANYYGVRELPTLWLVDENGIVKDVFVDPVKLESQLQTLLQSRKLSKR